MAKVFTLGEWLFQASFGIKSTWSSSPWLTQPSSALRKLQQRRDCSSLLWEGLKENSLVYLGLHVNASLFPDVLWFSLLSRGIDFAVKNIIVFLQHILGKHSVKHEGEKRKDEKKKKQKKSWYVQTFWSNTYRKWEINRNILWNVIQCWVNLKEIFICFLVFLFLLLYTFLLFLIPSWGAYYNC